MTGNQNSNNYEVLLNLVKAKVGISESTKIRDVYLNAIVTSVIKELSSINGIELNLSNDVFFMFAVDLSAYRYENREDQSLPRNLQIRLNNLMLTKIRDDVKTDVE